MARHAKNRFPFFPVAALVALLATGMPLSAQPEAQAVECATSPGAVVICNDAGTIIAKTPVSQDVAITSQEIRIDFDPTKTRLESESQITAPVGWTLKYSSDGGSNWSTTKPATPTEWLAVNAIMATGEIDSQGAESGYQVTTVEATLGVPDNSTFSRSSNIPAGDGWDVFFDDRGHVFNTFHRNIFQGIDCHTRAGESCEGWPFILAPLTTSAKATAVVDYANDHIWFNTNNDTKVGFGCVDISNINDPQWCGGSVSTGFIPIDDLVSTDDRYEGVGRWYRGYNGTLGLAQSGTRIFSLVQGTNKLICVDMSANSGLGASCGNPISIKNAAAAQWLNEENPEGWTGPQIYSPELIGWGERIAGVINERVFCIDATTLASCSSAFDAIRTMDLSGASPAPIFNTHVYVLPNASGEEVAICAVPSGECFDGSGNAVARPAGLDPNFRASSFTDYYGSFASWGLYPHYQKNPLTTGSRVYWGVGFNYDDGAIFCYDVAIDGGDCSNWPTGSVIKLANSQTENYSLVLDPFNPDCLWTNGHSGTIRSWDAVTGTAGCATLPSQAIFDAQVAVPRMSCSAESNIQGWREFELSGPSSDKYNSASLTVLTDGGAPIPGWENVPITTENARKIDLSSLSASISGQNPKFVVKFVGRTGVAGTDDAVVRVTAVGGAPELCITPTVVYPCPTDLGPVLSVDGQPGITGTFVASGTITRSGTASALTGATESISMPAVSIEDCSANLTGTARINGTLDPVAGATVQLLDSSGNAVLSGGVPVTTATGADGAYSFQSLAFGSYQVKFLDLGPTLVDSARVLANGSSYTTASSGAVISQTAVITRQDDGIVDASYAPETYAISRVVSAVAGETITFNPFDKALEGSLVSGDVGRSMTNDRWFDSMNLCSPDDPNVCNLTSVTVPEGTYTASNWRITFTPDLSFVSGASTPVKYVLGVSGETVSGNLGATVFATPSASPDTASGPLNTPLPKAVLSNDDAGLIPGTLALCGSNESPDGCYRLTVDVPNEGTYDVVNGEIVFTPVVGFTGTATPVTYQVADLAGQATSATYTPTITNPPAYAAPAPTAPLSASPDAITTNYDITQTYEPALNDSGELSPTTIRLCLPGETAKPEGTGCTGTVMTVQGQGVFTVLPNGKVEFDPEPTFIGTADAVTYQMADSTRFDAKFANSTITPTILPPTILATPEVIENEPGPSKLVTFTNLTAGESLASATAPIDESATCLFAMDKPEVCGLSVETEHGTFTLDISTGTVVFTSYADLAEDVEYTDVVGYRVFNIVGQQAESTLTAYTGDAPVLTDAADRDKLPPTLAYTGSYTATLFFIGAVMVILGMVILLGVRRKSA